jgi:hypothetical protein
LETITMLSVNAVIAKLIRGDEGDYFRQLWEGERVNVQEWEDDMALLSRIAYFAGKDPDLTWKVFSRSKRTTIQPAKRDEMVERAIEGCSSTYDVDANHVDLRDVEGEGVVADWARRLAPKVMPSYTACFRLARFLKNRPDLDVDEAVEEFCGAVGLDVDEFDAEYRRVAKVVLYGEGESPWEKAVEFAEAEPYPHVRGREKYRRFASILYHLGTIEERFYFNRPALVEMFGVSTMTITRWKDQMIDEGLVKCVKEAYSYSNRESQEFVWTGPAAR